MITSYQLSDNDPLGIEWNPRIVKPYGANVVIVGFIGGGKTTLMKNLFHLLRERGTKMDEGDHIRVMENGIWRKYLLPFRMLVHGTKKIINDDWLHFPVHRRTISITGNKFRYLMEGNEKAIVYFEDLPTWFNSPNEIIDEVTMNNFLSGVRHWESVFFVSAQSLADCFTYLPSTVLGKITHIISFNTAENMMMLQKWGIPIGACKYLDSVVKSLPPYNYIALDLRKKLITHQCINSDPTPLLRMLVRANVGEEVQDVTTLWEKNSNAGRKSSDLTKVPLRPEVQKICDRLLIEPSCDIETLAKEIGMPKGTTYQWISRLKQRGHLDKDVRYGSPRR